MTCARPFLPGQPILETDRLTLRGFTAEDLDPFTRLRGDPVVGRFVGGALAPYEAWRAFADVVGHLALRGYSEFAWIERGSGRFVGYGGPWRPEGWPDREIGWILDPECHGRGLAHEAAEACLAHARDDLGWPSAVSIIDPGNAHSRRLAERLGARPDGTWIDHSGHADILYRHEIGGAGAVPEPSGNAPLLSHLQPVLETERLFLRPYAASDFAPFAAFYADPASAFVGGPIPRHLAWRRFSAIVGHLAVRGYAPFSWIERATGAWVGFGGPWYPQGKPAPEIMWAMAPAFHGRGLAREAGRALLAHARDDLGWREAISVIAPDNAPSARLAKALGATPGPEWRDPSGFDAILYRHDLR